MKDPNFSRMITLHLSAEQQQHLKSLTGVRQREVRLSQLQLAGYTLAAAAVGSDAFPVTRTPAMVQRMLQSYRYGSSDTPVAAVPLNPEQVQEIQRLTSRTMSAILLAPEEFSVHCHEKWAELPDVIGRSFQLVPAGSPAVGDDRRVIRLPTPGDGSSGAFGTGKHQTTRLALGLLEDYVRPGDRVLDLGTGSGILAVAAARMGAREVLALDIDPVAVATARETVAINDLGEIISVGEGSSDGAKGSFDVVLANIYANVLIALREDLARLVRPAGILVTSGVIALCADGVERALTGQGFDLIERRAGDDPWRGHAFRAGVQGSTTYSAVQMHGVPDGASPPQRTEPETRSRWEEV